MCCTVQCIVSLVHGRGCQLHLACAAVEYSGGRGGKDGTSGMSHVVHGTSACAHACCLHTVSLSTYLHTLTLYTLTLQVHVHTASFHTASFHTASFQTLNAFPPCTYRIPAALVSTVCIVYLLSHPHPALRHHHQCERIPIVRAQTKYDWRLRGYLLCRALTRAFLGNGEGAHLGADDALCIRCSCNTSDQVSTPQPAHVTAKHGTLYWAILLETRAMRLQILYDCSLGVATPTCNRSAGYCVASHECIG
jgi:hypothetical protein